MRREFLASVKREAMARSGGACEAIGPRYGLAPGQRCGKPIGKGAVQFDHYPRPAHDPHEDTTTIGNCVACCPACNQYANHHEDTPREAKMKRVSRREALHDARMARKAGHDVPDPIPHRKPRPAMKGRGFAPGKRTLPSRPFRKVTP